MTPLPLVFSGALFSFLAGALIFIALDTDTPGLLVVAWIVGGLAGLVLFVGLIALAVEIGMRAADR